MAPRLLIVDVVLSPTSHYIKPPACILPKWMFSQKLFFESSLLLKWLVRRWSRSPNQQRRPLPSILYISLFHDATVLKIWLDYSTATPRAGASSGSSLTHRYRTITPRWAKPCHFLYSWILLLTFLALGIARAHISVGLRRSGGIFVCRFVFVCFALYYKLHE